MVATPVASHIPPQGPSAAWCVGRRSSSVIHTHPSRQTIEVEFVADTRPMCMRAGWLPGWQPTRQPLSAKGDGGHTYVKKSFWCGAFVQESKRCTQSPRAPPSCPAAAICFTRADLTSPR
eukprot:GHVU01174355.1.p1 GENE.GHVU01174355.1~~GHVU01174355.1.p1  ORF type:complete len:120 (-),score=5.16 GHVU01174355.1:105-464(-)